MKARTFLDRTSAHFPKSARHRGDIVRGLREAMGTSKYIIPVPLFDLTSPKGILPRVSQGPQTGGTSGFRLAAALVGLAIALGACTHTGDTVAAISYPDDYRMRHPIAVEEANQSIVVFVGRGRGGLTAEQRADVMGLAQNWAHEGTGTINADVPVNTPNARAAADSLREIQALLAAAGVPPRGFVVRQYHPTDPHYMAAIRLSYPRMTAVAGPCGLWPEDIGPSINNQNYYENKQYYNFGCAYQRNMAAMVENPSDLVQPRPETPAYAARRGEAFQKYRTGATTTTSYPEADKAKLSDTGK